MGDLGGFEYFARLMSHFRVSERGHFSVASPLLEFH